MKYLYISIISETEIILSIDNKVVEKLDVHQCAGIPDLVGKLIVGLPGIKSSGRVIRANYHSPGAFDFIAA